MTEYLYRYLPSGNAHQFDALDADLIKRGVDAEVSDINKGRLYRVPVADLPKMPRDESGPYFGTDEEGWPFHQGDWEEDRIDWGGTAWRKLQQVARGQI
jgi:hypothetical protein